MSRSNIVDAWKAKIVGARNMTISHPRYYLHLQENLT